MFKPKMIKISSILRMIAMVAILSFSFEMASSFMLSDDVQLEIVDVDWEDDVEFDDEFDADWNFSVMEAIEIGVDVRPNAYRSPLVLTHQYLQELPTPPPDCA